MRKTHFAVTLGATVALGVSAIAYADGVSENEAQVEGKVKPTKLDKKKYKPVNLLTGVRTPGTVTGTQQNPEQEHVSWGKNVKIKPSAAPTCSAPIEFQSTDAARAACPGKSYLGSGKANIELPGGVIYEGLTVSVFNGPGKNEVRLHTYDPRLAGATPTVAGKIVKSKAGRKYGQALQVDDAPDVAGDTGKITAFNAKLSKKSKVATARCKSKKFLWNREVTYDDGTKEDVTLEQKCKRK
ncbi:MAG: hypothetical protein K0R88_1842 [Solirubrobacterales bacterium]|nr:hypothetical protein [Solirubrobacterales bacterium]